MVNGSNKLKASIMEEFGIPEMSHNISITIFLTSSDTFHSIIKSSLFGFSFICQQFTTQETM